MNRAQKYTSANTSINSSKLPRIYKLTADRIASSDKVIDYGCGKYFDNYNLGSNFFGYDPYNRPNDEILNDKYDIALCSNVLNVIAEVENRVDLLRRLKEIAQKVFITVYEGDKTACGKETKNDCYQLNRKTCDYIPELVYVFGPSKVKYNRKGYFECEGDCE